jgi:hypothetical protein
LDESVADWFDEPVEESLEDPVVVGKEELDWSPIEVPVVV